MRGLKVHGMRIGQASLDDAGNAYPNGLDVISIKAVLLAQHQHAIDARRNARCRRVAFHERIQEVETLPSPPAMMVGSHSPA